MKPGTDVPSRGTQSGTAQLTLETDPRNPAVSLGGGTRRSPDPIPEGALSPGTLGEALAGVYQLRPRSTTKERVWVKEWRRLLGRGQQGAKRIREGPQLLQLVKLVELAFPEDDFESVESGNSRPRFPVVPSTPIPDQVKPGEQILRHVERILTREPGHAWIGLHQVIRVALSAVEATVFPEEMKTRSSHLPLEHVLACLAGCNALMYLVLRPTMKRSRHLILLLPPREKKGLGRQGREGAAEWRQAVSTYLDRHRQALRGGEGYDPRQRIAEVYHEATAEEDYVGFTREWQKN